MRTFISKGDKYGSNFHLLIVMFGITWKTNLDMEAGQWKQFFPLFLKITWKNRGDLYTMCPYEGILKKY